MSSMYNRTQTSYSVGNRLQIQIRNRIGEIRLPYRTPILIAYTSSSCLSKDSQSTRSSKNDCVYRITLCGRRSLISVRSRRSLDIQLKAPLTSKKTVEVFQYRSLFVCIKLVRSIAVLIANFPCRPPSYKSYSSGPALARQLSRFIRMRSLTFPRYQSSEITLYALGTFQLGLFGFSSATPIACLSRVTGHGTGGAESQRHDSATQILIRGFPYPPYRSSFVRYNIVPIQREAQSLRGYRVTIVTPSHQHRYTSVIRYPACAPSSNSSILQLL